MYSIVRCLPAGLAVAAALTLSGCGHAGTAGAPHQTLTAGARTAEHAAQDGATLSIEDFIQRQVPGLVMVRSGGNLIVQIRGQGTVGGNDANNALVVIDGVAQETANALLNLSPTDVQKVEVLKGAAAGRYGMRGANGVLVVTLKRGM